MKCHRKYIWQRTFYDPILIDFAWKNFILYICISIYSPKLFYCWHIFLSLYLDKIIWPHILELPRDFLSVHRKCLMRAASEKLIRDTKTSYGFRSCRCGSTISPSVWVPRNYISQRHLNNVPVSPLPHVPISGFLRSFFLPAISEVLGVDHEASCVWLT